MKWTTKNSLYVAIILGVLAWAVFIGNIVYQTIYPFEVAVFHSITVAPGPYRIGDVVRYTVDVDKLFYTPSVVVRDIICMRGAYQIQPNERGESQTGHFLFKRHFIVPEEVDGPDTCILRSTFSYENINQYHTPIKYSVDSNEFTVGP
jgi:hypothetical protein